MRSNHISAGEVRTDCCLFGDERASVGFVGVADVSNVDRYSSTPRKITTTSSQVALFLCHAFFPLLKSFQHSHSAHHGIDNSLTLTDNYGSCFWMRSGARPGAVSGWKHKDIDDDTHRYGADQRQGLLATPQTVC